MREAIKAHTLLDATTSSSAVSDWHANSNNGSADTTYQAVLGATGTTTGIVNIEVSNDMKNGIVMGTISLSGASHSDGFAVPSAAWKYSRAVMTALGASCDMTVTMGD
jgi:hypothetical protein